MDMTRTAEQIEEKLVEMIALQADVPKAKVKRETGFMTDLGMDSLDVTELIMNIEDGFDLSVTEEEARELRTVGDAIDYVIEHAS